MIIIIFFFKSIAATSCNEDVPMFMDGCVYLQINTTSSLDSKLWRIVTRELRTEAN